MDDRARVALRDLVAGNGEQLLVSRERLRGLLSDECPECTREINVLMIAVQAQVPAELHAHPSATESRVAVTASILRLERAFGLGRPAAAWAALSIAYSLGRISEDQFRALLTELNTDSANAPRAERSTAEPSLPQPLPAYRPPPPPKPVSQPPLLPPLARPPSQAPTPPPPRPVSPPAAPAAAPAYPSNVAPYPAPQPASGGGRLGLGIGIGIGVLAISAVVAYSLTHHTPSTDTASSAGTRSEQRAPEQPKPDQSSPPPSDPAAPGGFTTYADKSGMFQLSVPEDWLYRRSEADDKLENADCHMIRAALYPKDAERSDMDGWMSAGVRVSIYLPPNGQVWLSDWAADWQKRSFQSLLKGYSKFQNTAIEPVQLGNVSASTTAVMGEAPSTISEAEVARLYVGVSQKYLVVVDVAMPASKRALFESTDETVRRTFELKVP